MDDVFQFADVPWPTVAAQFLFGTGADADPSVTQALAVGLDEMPGQRQDVAGRSRSGLSSRLTTFNR